MTKKQDFLGTRKGRQAFDFERLIFKRFLNATDFQDISKHARNKVKSHKKSKRTKHKHLVA